jgi:hypothetical protein
MNNRRKHWRLGVLGLLALVVTGCDAKDRDAIVRIALKIADKADQATAGVRGPVLAGWKPGQPDLDSLTAPQRVKARLRWDKALVDCDINVEAKDNAIELRGQVPALEQRRRAVDLAESTVGVEKVDDNVESPH